MISTYRCKLSSRAPTTKYGRATLSPRTLYIQRAKRRGGWPRCCLILSTAHSSESGEGAAEDAIFTHTGDVAPPAKYVSTVELQQYPWRSAFNQHHIA